MVKTLVKTLGTLSSELPESSSDIKEEVNQFVFTVDWMVKENNTLQKKLKSKKKAAKEKTQLTKTLVQEKEELAAQVLSLQRMLEEKENAAPQ
mmetsp:Transcript_21514/g.42705  ORF Transcript_21514/g.42705 Transcript_21514/m.42705 type:complete len:93 (+) Transcript_21514:679-957(+)